MPLANFFDKVSLSAAQRIKGYDRSGFEQQLLSHRIGIVYGDNAVHTSEGKMALDLLVRLVSRLYPSINFINLCGDNDSIEYTQLLESTARKINPVIDCTEGLPATIHLCVGKIESYEASVPVFFIGSHNWNSFFSLSTPQFFYDSGNPFGAGAAVCFALANLFRFIFRVELNHPPLDNDFRFSTIDHTINTASANPPLPESIPVSFSLIGTGAIGNATLWSFLHLSGAAGTIQLIDDQLLALSNLQRYVLMDHDDVDKRKVDLLQAKFAGTQLSLTGFPQKWQEAVGTLSAEQQSLFAVAIDTAEERIKVQSVLPRKILNAWTGPDSLGLSRHLHFETDLCLSCLYLPNGKAKSESEKIAESLGMESKEPFIRRYLANNLPIDDVFITFVSQAMKLNPDELLPYKGQPVQIFYSEAICGGKVVPIHNQSIEVPLAHESVLAGILLAAEIIIDALSLREEPEVPLTKINLLEPLHTHLTEQEGKHFTGHCICQDEIYKKRYREKWA